MLAYHICFVKHPKWLLERREGMRRFWDDNFTDCVRFFLAQALSWAYKDTSKKKFVKLLLDRAA